MTRTDELAALQAKKRQEAERTSRKLFLALCRQAFLPAPTPEYHFAKDEGRKWRFDWAWPGERVALEVEGGVWSGGRHTRGKGFLADMSKYNNAAMRGWRIVRCTPSTLLTTDTIMMLKRILERAA